MVQRSGRPASPGRGAAAHRLVHQGRSIRSCDSSASRSSPPSRPSRPPSFAQQPPRPSVPSRSNQPSPGTPAAAVDARARRRGQGGHPGDPRGDRQALGADGQHRVPLRHDRAAADRLAEPDQGQPLDPRQVPAVRAGRTRTSSRGRSSGPGRAARPRAGSSCRSSSGSCWSRPAGAPRPRAQCAGRWSTSRPQSTDELSRLQGEAQGGLGPPRRGLGPALAQAGRAEPRSARCGGGCATSCACGSSARSSRSSWSPRGSPGCSRDSNKEHGLVNMTGATEQLHPGRAPRGVPDHRVVRPDLAAAQARAGRDRDRPEEHVQRRPGRGLQHGRRDPRLREARRGRDHRRPHR